MRRLFVLCIIVLTVPYVMAVEKKPIKDVGLDEILSETQVVPIGVADNHAAFVWWIPIEYWGSLLARDMTTSETDKNAVINAASGVSILAVTQADISTFGTFTFYSKEDIEKEMVVTYTDADNNKLRLPAMQQINPDLEMIILMSKPMLESSMGSLGKNMHFYVFDDKSKSSLRLIDPYREGVFDIKLAKRNGDLLTASIQMPLNSLFVPRKCPNGKNAHISWKYCPWSGKRLED